MQSDNECMQFLLQRNVKALLSKITEAGFGYDNSVSLQTDDAGHVGAAVLVPRGLRRRFANQRRSS